jgi:hypothetical protein
VLFARYGWLLLAAALGGCLGDPERGNPLDPLSDNFSDAGAVAGTVTTFYAPFDGLAGASVRLAPLDGGTERVAQTDAAGRFTLPAVPSGTYVVTAEAEGFAALTDTLEVTLGQLAELALRLDGLPVVTVRTLHTEHVNRWFPQEPLLQLAVEVGVTDPDGPGDVEVVHLVIPSLGFADTLRAVAGEPGVYGRVFSEDALPVPVQELLGRSLHVEATDQVGAHGRSTDVQIVRIIDAFPDALAPGPGPGGLPVVGAQPTLVWASFDLPFTFTYRVDVTLLPVPGQEVLLHSYTGLPPSDTTFVVPDVLDASTFSWTISAEDSFGNLSRSRPLGFVVGAARS